MPLMPDQKLERLLYVEDDPDIQEIAVLALAQVGGFSVVAARSGAEALALAPECRPDLILLDVMMPGMDGLATLEALRGDPETESVPVIFMTAKVQDREIESYRRAGAVGVIAKPFDPMTLAEQVREIWRTGHLVGSGCDLDA
jgi:two-component system, OmpR family, response regulator